MVISIINYGTHDGYLRVLVQYYHVLVVYVLAYVPKGCHIIGIS